MKKRFLAVILAMVMVVCLLPTDARAAEDPYITFSSTDSFKLKTNNTAKNWDGTLEYSTDLTTWSTWNGTDTLNSSASNKLYLRGTGNTYMTNSNANAQFVLTGKNIACTGNIENLLDYTTVAAGNHPAMAAKCFYSLFNGCAALTSAPALPATALANYCYSNMFNGCTALTSAPALPATTLAEYCYNAMFSGCTSLKVSEAQDSDYTVEWRIPTTGTATVASNWSANMLNGTGGSFKGTPTVNTTYYLYAPAPTITDPTVNKTVTVVVGNTGTMSVTAQNATGYQWYVNRNDGNGFVAISGATNASYTTGIVTLNHNGYQYYCIVSGAAGTTPVTSPIFTLNVIEQPDIPATGDGNLPGLWLGIMLLAGAGLAGSIVLSRRKPREKTE